MKLLAGKVAVGVVDKKGNPIKALKSICTKDTFKNLVRTMAVVGFSAGILKNDALAKMDPLAQRVIIASTNATLRAAADIVLDGARPDKASILAARTIIADTLCADMAGSLGKAYREGTLPNVLHEALHGLNAYIGEQIITGNNRRAKAAFIGAVVGEVTSKIYTQNTAIFSDENASAADLQRAVDRGIDFSKLTAAAVSGLMGLPGDAAVQAAERAVQENGYSKAIQALKNLEPTPEEKEEYARQLANKRAKSAAEREALQAVFQEVLDEITTNPANFAAECGVAVADCFVPGGVMNATDYLFGDKSANEALDAAGPDLVMTVFGASIAKGGAKGAKIINGLRKRYHTKLETFANNQRVRKINKRRPINHKYAGKVFPAEKLPENLRQKYPHGVPFTGNGHPDFARYAKKKVKIKVTGVHYADQKLANGKAGYQKTPKGYTWHHHQDGKTMLLIPEDLHYYVKHTGGVAKVKKRGNK